jgi:hypothetical protein
MHAQTMIGVAAGAAPTEPPAYAGGLHITLFKPPATLIPAEHHPRPW